MGIGDWGLGIGDWGLGSDKVDTEVLDAAKQLKIVVRAGAGYDNIDLAAATAHHVVAESLYFFIIINI